MRKIIFLVTVLALVVFLVQTLSSQGSTWLTKSHDFFVTSHENTAGFFASISGAVASVLDAVLQKGQETQKAFLDAKSGVEQKIRDVQDAASEVQKTAEQIKKAQEALGHVFENGEAEEESTQ
jgi:peptidoglycan hydrolase CwlO-like protein